MVRGHFQIHPFWKTNGSQIRLGNVNKPPPEQQKSNTDVNSSTMSPMLRLQQLEPITFVTIIAN